jgi:hypothetical protein
MLDYLATDRCRMRSCASQLDDLRGAADCGRCDNCGGLACPAVSADAASSAAERLARPGVVVEPAQDVADRAGPIGLDLKGKIAEAAEEGRAVARLTDLGTASALRDLFREATADGPVPVPWSGRARGARRLAATGDGDRRRRVGHPADAGRDLAAGSPATSRCRSSALRDRRPSVPPAAAPSTPPSGSRR